MSDAASGWSPRRSIGTLGKVTVSGVLVLYVLRSVDLDAVQRVLLGTDALFFAIAAALSVGNPLISSKKLDVLLRAKATGVPFRSVVRYYYIGKFFNAFLPATVGGDVVKAHLLSKDAGHFGDAYSSVFMERFLGLLAVIGLGTVASLLFVKLLPGVVFTVLFGIYLPATVLVSAALWWDGLPAFLRAHVPARERVTSSGIARKLFELYAAIHEFKRDRTHIWLALLISVVHQTSVIVSYYALAEAIGMGVDPWYFFVLVPIATIIVFLPISIAGIGVQEATFVFLFSLVGATTDQAVSLSLLVHGLALFPMVVGAVAYLAGEGAWAGWIEGLRGRQ